MWSPRGSAAWRLWVALRCQPLTESRIKIGKRAVFTRMKASTQEAERHCSRRVAGRTGGSCLPPVRLLLAIDALQLALGNRDRALGVFTAGAVVGEHVDHQEVRDGRRRLFADLADARGRQRALAGLAEHLVLRVRGPNRRVVVGVERVG